MTVSDGREASAPAWRVAPIADAALPSEAESIAEVQRFLRGPVFRAMSSRLLAPGEEGPAAARPPAPDGSP